MEKEIYLLTTQSCTKCPNIKKWAKDLNVDVIILDVENDDLGVDIAVDLGIMSVPTIVDNRTGTPKAHVGEGSSFAFLHENKN